MNDTPTPAEKRSYRSLLVIAGAIVLIGVLGFVASKAGLDKALVKQQVDAFAARLKEQGKLQGRVVELTYGDISIDGSFSDKHAVIHEPRLLIKPDGQPAAAGGETNALVLTSAAMEIYPESADLSAMRIELPHPINFAGEEAPDKSLLKITAITPFAVSVAQSRKSDVDFVHISHSLPREIDLTYLREQQAIGEEDAEPVITPVYETLKLTTNKGDVDMSYSHGDIMLGQSKLDIQEVVLSPESGPEAAIKIASITGAWNNVLNEHQLNEVNSRFTVDSITAGPEVIPYAPISLDFDMNYEGAMPQTPEQMATLGAQKSAFKLKTLSLTTKDASLNATADFVAQPEDILPVGTATITLTNLPFVVGELKKHGLLDEGGEALLAMILNAVTGTEYAQIKDVNIDVNRARGGAFQIGHTTFEELFALLLTGKIQQLKGGVVPVPAPGEPAKEAPGMMEVPADGNRG